MAIAAHPDCDPMLPDKHGRCHARSNILFGAANICKHLTDVADACQKCEVSRSTVNLMSHDMLAVAT